MHKIMKRMLDPDIPLRKRLFQLLSTIALAEFIIVNIYNLIQGASGMQTVIMCAGTIAFAFTVSYTFRSGRMRAGSAVSGILYFLIYPLTFFSAGGMYGGAPVVSSFALVYVYLVTEKWERWLSLAVCISGSAACFMLSYYHPELIKRHTAAEENIESFLSIMLVTLLLCVLFAFVTKVYLEENRIVQAQKREIEELNRKQKRFFSSMSHEIRTPVNAIIGMNEATMRESISEVVMENSRNIEVASKILLHTINEILDLSRLESGSVEIVKTDYRPASMLSDIVSMTWLRAHEKGLEFRIDVDPNLPSVLRGDEMRIKQILLNVTTNAVKYTKEGLVHLHISGITDENGLYRSVYEVSDTGIGIREENIPLLFSEYRRMDEHKTNAIEGTGLGLFIVKQYLDMMDGTVEVSSEYGKGSVFHIEIPQEIVDASPVGSQDVMNDEPDEAAGETAGTAASDIRLLVVDDTPMNLMVVKKLLKDSKTSVDTAASGMEALQKTLDNEYDIILMDHQMPEMDGIECLHRIREQDGGKCRESRIVCLTANVGADMEKLYRSEGFDGYLTKPIKRKVLEDEISFLTERIML